MKHNQYMHPSYKRKTVGAIPTIPIPVNKELGKESNVKICNGFERW